MPCIVSTLPVFQLPIGWLKRAASRNMAYIVVTDDTSQSPMGWLNADAPKNVARMLVTLDTSQRPMSWLNAAAPLNVLCIFVTFDTSHPEMSASKSAFEEKSPPISVMALTSQSGISVVPPSFAVGQFSAASAQQPTPDGTAARQRSMSAWSSAFVSKARASAEAAPRVTVAARRSTRDGR